LLPISMLRCFKKFSAADFVHRGCKGARVQMFLWEIFTAKSVKL